MSDKIEVRQRKNDKTKDKNKSENEFSKNGKSPIINASELKKLTEERRQELGRKIFKRSLKRICYIFITFTFLYAYQWFKTDTSFTPFVTTKDEIFDVPFIKQVPCGDDYKIDQQKFPKCVPNKICGRLVIDNLINERESSILLLLFKKALLLSPLSVNGSASILDLHSGALSYGDKFINLYNLLKDKKKDQYFTKAEFDVYKEVKNKIHQYIAKQFQIPKDSLYLTSPTFFSKLTEYPPRSLHDQYWHLHIDKQTYKSFHYTSLLYLNTYYDQFGGGRFVFADKKANYTVEPKKSRVLVFTSGKENPHFVEKVEKGVRYAITISFTCDSQLKIEDPKFIE